MIARRKPIKRGKPPKRSGIKRNARRARETHEKAHGPKARGEWIATLPCAACGVVGYSQPAHVLGCAGTGLKKGPETIAPLCGRHYCSPPRKGTRMYVGCHRLFDQYRWIFNDQYPAFNPEAEAAKQNAAWLASLPPLEASPK